MPQLTEVASFFNKVKDFSGVVQNNQQRLDVMHQAQQALIAGLEGALVDLQQPHLKKNPFYQEISGLASKTEESIASIHQAQMALQNRIRLQEAYQNKLIILIFGKVNSGKSSFANYLVDLFQATTAQDSVEYFAFQQGKKTPMQAKFEQGCTETTAQIQGVEMNNLVLLDSPGLHSVTEENGEITRQYSDSADLILWLSGSNSPGQIQELEALSEELSKDKILIPVITKSDSVEEDEQNGEIVQVLSMKPAEVQKAQENDVYQRACAKLQAMNINTAKQLKTPVSLSVKYAQDNKDTEEILTISGINRLFSALNARYDQVIAEKSTNIEKQVMHYHQNLCALIEQTVQAYLSKLDESLKTQIQKIKQDAGFISERVVSDVVSKMPDMVTKYEHQRDTAALGREVNQYMMNAIDQQLSQMFNELFDQMDKVNTELTQLTLQAQFTDETCQYSKTTGKGLKTIVSSVFSIGGGLAGSALGPAGTAGGAVTGAAIGEAIGDWIFVSHKTISEVIGVDSSTVETELIQKIKEITPLQVEARLEQLLTAFAPLQRVIDNALIDIENFKTQEL